MLHVCSLPRLRDTVAAAGARHVITLLDAAAPIARPPGVAADDHLIIRVNDILEPQEGLVCPDGSHVETLIDFVGRWAQAGPLVIHCFAGISRSTASAFITACAIAPNRSEIQIAAALRRASRTATPNARLVALADERLARNGRMVAAIQAIGRGTTAFEGEPFRLSTAPDGA